MYVYSIVVPKVAIITSANCGHRRPTSTFIQIT